METNEVLDGRTDLDKEIDGVLGASGSTELDKQFARIMRHASDLFLNNKQLKKYLLLGEECDRYVIMCMDVIANAKRSDIISRIEERLNVAGLGITDIRVNDWLAVYGLARCITTQSTVKEMSAEFLSSHAYRTLAIMKVAVERSEYAYTFKPGWADKVSEWLRDGVRGRNLEAAVKEHKVYVDDLNRSNRLKGMTPERAAQEIDRETAKEQDKARNAINKAADAVRDRAIEANVSPEDLLCTLVSRKIIPAPLPVKTPMDGLDMANAMTPELAAQFAEALCSRGNYGLIMTISSTLVGWLHQQKAAADRETKILVA